MMYYGLNGLSPFHMFGFGSIFVVIFWGLVIYGFYLLIQRGEGKNEDALSILKSRYAKGNITREEFESIKKDIK